MKVLAIYAINEHITELMLEAYEARLARQASQRPSVVTRLARAARSAVVRLRTNTSPTLA